MNFTARPLIALLLMAGGVASATTGSADDAPVRASVARLEQAWNAGDMTLWAREYWPDGEFINILGSIMLGPQEFIRQVTPVMQGVFRGSQFDGRIRRIRFLASNVALVEVDVRVTHFRALPPGIVATEPGLLVTRLKHVFELRDGLWKIAASQNTAALPRPASKPTTQRASESR